jgi:hypothetical protein
MASLTIPACLLGLGVILSPTFVMAQSTNLTNLSIAWRLCEQHGKLLGHPTLIGPARWVFEQGYGGCETVEKLAQKSKSEAVDPNKLMADKMLIDKAIHDPNGMPGSQ